MRGTNCKSMYMGEVCDTISMYKGVTQGCLSGCFSNDKTLMPERKLFKKERKKKKPSSDILKYKERNNRPPSVNQISLVHNNDKAGNTGILIHYNKIHTAHVCALLLYHNVCLYV